MTPAQALAYLDSLGPSHVVLGLERMQAVLDRLGHPERAYPSVHVAGTNGKGSTCAMIEASLRASGLRTAFYSSPHLHRVNERIKLAGEPITEENLARAISLVADAAKGLSLTYFEFLTAVALVHFREGGAQAAVLETGLGGRLDATNVVAPVATAITSLGLDHQQILGPTLADIAREKAGILKRGVPCAVAAPASDALNAIAERATTVGAELWLEGREFALDENGYRGPRWRLPSVEVGLAGPHQRQNAAVALAALEIASGSLPVTPEAARIGVAEAHWPGRLESFFPRAGVEVVLDGAHNPQAAAALARAVRAMQPRREVRLVFGVLEDKEWLPMLEALMPLARAAYLANPQNPRGRSPETYFAQARALCAEVHRCASVSQALRAAIDQARPDERVIVCGSLYVVAEARDELMGM
jgi:dihydrofolate synthase/folylpolyglutamate synthase